MINVYLEYESYKQKLYAAQNKFDKLLKRKEELFDMTQPTSPGMGEKVSGGSPRNRFDSYLIQKEEENLDDLIDEARDILEDRVILLESKLEELKASKNLYDKIYYYRYVENYKINRIAKMVGYSEPQTYRILDKIKRQIS